MKSFNCLKLFSSNLNDKKNCRWNRLSTILKSQKSFRLHLCMFNDFYICIKFEFFPYSIWFMFRRQSFQRKIFNNLNLNRLIRLNIRLINANADFDQKLSIWKCTFHWWKTNGRISKNFSPLFRCVKMIDYQFHTFLFSFCCFSISM